MEVELVKRSRSFDLTDGSDTAKIQYEGKYAAINVPDAVTLTFYGSATKDGSFSQLKRRTSADTDWSAFELVTMTLDAAGIYPLPPELLPVPWVQIQTGGPNMTVELLQVGTGRIVNE